MRFQTRILLDVCVCGVCLCVYLFVYVSVCLCVYLFVCVSVCVRVGELCDV